MEIAATNSNSSPGNPQTPNNITQDTTEPIAQFSLEDVDLNTFTDQEIITISLEISKRKKQLETENVIFETFLTRIMPGMTNEDLGDIRKDLADADSLEKKEARREKKKKTEKKESDRPLSLSLDQKNEIAVREVEELRDVIQKQKEDWAKVLDNYKAELEEADVRFAELKKFSYEFNREIVGLAINPRTGKILAERVVRYYEDKIKFKEAIIEKTRLKNATLKVAKNKLALQLKQKEEMGEVLHAIDFDQLQIENKQYLSKIEERNSELIKLKVTAGLTIQILNSHRQKLQALMEESVKLKREINQRKDLLVKFSAENEMVMNDIKKAEKMNTKMLVQIEEYKVPQVMDYVVLKAHENDLEKSAKNWQRKVDIMTHSHSKVKKMWNDMISRG